jgi:cytochrome c biogenesis protein CcmG/thiol:disulfide interchange protein DsbE
MSDATPAPRSWWRFVLGLARDWALALGFAVVAWAVWVRFLAPGPRTSGPAPPFSLPAASGGEIALAALGDGPIILNFWFTSCGPCRAEIPDLAAYHAAHPEVPLIGVSIDSMPPARLAQLSEKLGITWPVAHDQASAVSDSYGVSLFPTTIVVRNGAIEDVHLGRIDAPGLEALVDTL